MQAIVSYESSLNLGYSPRLIIEGIDCARVCLPTSLIALAVTPNPGAHLSWSRSPTLCMPACLCDPAQP